MASSCCTQVMLEFLVGGDWSAADARTAAQRLVGRTLCRLALTGVEAVATLQAVLLDDVMQQVRPRFVVTADGIPARHANHLPHVWQARF